MSVHPRRLAVQRPIPGRPGRRTIATGSKCPPFDAWHDNCGPRVAEVCLSVFRGDGESTGDRPVFRGFLGRPPRPIGQIAGLVATGF